MGVASLRKWANRLPDAFSSVQRRKEAAGETRPRLVPIAHPQVPEAANLEEVAGGSIEIQLRGGIVVRVRGRVSEGALADVVAALSRRVGC